MTGDRLKVLGFMNQITNEVGLKEFTEKVGLTPDTILESLKELAKVGLVHKVDRRYSITTEGKIILKLLNPVPNGKEFYFYSEIGKYTGRSAKSLKTFFEQVKKVNVSALELHTTRGDFENWITTVLEDLQLASEFKKMKKSPIKGEELRNKIISITEARYNTILNLLST